MSQDGRRAITLATFAANVETHPATRSGDIGFESARSLWRNVTLSGSRMGNLNHFLDRSLFL